MEVDFTGRQTEVTADLRALANTTLERIEKLAGKASAANVVFSTEKYRHTAEVLIQTQLQEIVGTAESTSMESALRGALDKAEAQAVRNKEKLKTRKRAAGSDKASVEPGLERASHASRVAQPLATTAAVTNGNGQAPSEKKPNGHALAYEPHITRTIDPVALRPMSLEEAVKEAEHRDWEVFVFRDKAEQVKVLHRKRDGLMELIELP